MKESCFLGYLSKHFIRQSGSCFFIAMLSLALWLFYVVWIQINRCLLLIVVKYYAVSMSYTKLRHEKYFRSDVVAL